MFIIKYLFGAIGAALGIFIAFSLLLNELNLDDIIDGFGGSNLIIGAIIGGLLGLAVGSVFSGKKDSVKTEGSFRYCTQCGQQLSYGARFCTKCGNAIESESK